MTRQTDDDVVAGALRLALARLEGRLRPCAECGVEFPARNARARFCGDACRQRAHRAKATR